MHWLSEQLGNLHDILERQYEYEQLIEKKVTGAEEGRKKARDDFFHALKDLVLAIAKREGVMAAFSCHEGLLIERAGESDNFEALAAVGQNLVFNGTTAMKSLKFGALSQFVLVGGSEKLAFFVMGQVEIGIVAKRDINLSVTLG
jgi:predicted regulator of Ras-like GTPase activity (Roadblock/LC7/MglB family)